MGGPELSDDDQKSNEEEDQNSERANSEQGSNPQPEESEEASGLDDAASGSEEKSALSANNSSSSESDHHNKKRLLVDNTFSDSQDGPVRSRSTVIRDIIREAAEQPDLYGIRRSGRQRKEVTRLSLGNSSDEKSTKRKTRFKNRGSDFSESASDDSSYSDSQPRKRRVTRSRTVRSQQSTRHGRQAMSKYTSSEDENDDDETGSESEESSDDDVPRRRVTGSRSQQKSKSGKSGQRMTRRRETTKKAISYKEESDDVTESDDLIEVETAEVDEDKEAAETIEKVIRRRTGLKGATGSKTAIYNVEKDGDPNEGVGAAGKDETEMQYLIKWKNWSHMHNTWESEESLHEQKVNGIKKLENFIKREEELDCWRRHANPEDWEYYECQQEMMDDLYKKYCEVERIVTHFSPKPGYEANEYLVKWHGLPYSECTREDSELVLRRFPLAVDEYKKRQKSTFSPSGKACKVLKTRPKFVALKEQPEYLGSSELRLRDYQLEGLNWLLNSWCRENSAILADEMGLGKTIQTISFISVLMNVHHMYGPFLLVVPLSTIVTWQQEFQTWAPHANVVVYIGDVNSRNVIREYEFYHSGSKRLKVNVIITTYEILLKDKALLGSISWAVLAVDEAHRLKNDDSLLYKVLFNFDTNHRVFITGTPLQNSLKELWSLLHFIMPQKFVRWEDFEQKHKAADQTGFRQLHQELEPFLLRRVKKDVEKSLPAKVEQILRVEMSKVQRQYYRWILTKNYKALSKGVKGSIAGFINLVMELKKCCNHAFLVKSPDSSDESVNHDRFELLVKSSGKLILLDKLLLKLRESGHRVLIFSQMVRMLDILAEYLQLRRFPFQRLDGTIRGDVRKQAMDHFNAEGSSDFCFLLSTRAGGLGVNLATADTVIIFDSDWNPQNDLQAQARAHRIGQKNQVSVYRLVTKNSVEEDIVERAKKKMVLDHLVIQRMDTTGRTVLSRDGLSGRSNSIPFSKEELNMILKFGAEELFKEADDEDEDQVDIDDILRMAETRNTEEMKNSATDELLSQFKVVSFENLEDEELEARDKVHTAKDWDDIIPEADRKKIEEEELKQQMEELNLPPRQRKQVNETGITYPDFDGDEDRKKRRGNKYDDESETNDEESDEGADRQTQKRGRSRAARDGVRGFSDAELRRLVKSIRKFPRPKDRLEDVAGDAELQEKSQADMLYLVDLILQNCHQTMKEFDEKSKEQISATSGAADAGQARRAIGRASFKLSNVSVNAKSILQALDELEPLAVVMPSSAKEREKYQLKMRVKSALFDCEWDTDDDSHLLRGVYDYGFGNWEAIKMDESLKLQSKILPNGELRPQGKHLQSRTEYLLKLLRKETGEDTAKIKSPKKIRAKPVSKKVKSKEIIDDNQGSDEDSDQGTRDIDGSQDKTSEGKRRPHDKAVKDENKGRKQKSDNKTDDKDAAKKKQSRKKKNAGIGPLHITTGETVSVDEQGNLPENVFAECKERMRAVKRSLKHLGDPDPKLSDKEKLMHTRECLLKIGNHIGDILSEFKDAKKIKEWKSYLWMFVSQFTEFDPIRLHKLYKHAVKNNDDAKDKQKDKNEHPTSRIDRGGTAANELPNKKHQHRPHGEHHHHHHHHSSHKKSDETAVSGGKHSNHTVSDKWTAATRPDRDDHSAPSRSSSYASSNINHEMTDSVDRSLHANPPGKEGQHFSRQRFTDSQHHSWSNQGNQYGSGSRDYYSSDKPQMHQSRYDQRPGDVGRGGYRGGGRGGSYGSHSSHGYSKPGYGESNSRSYQSKQQWSDHAAPGYRQPPSHYEGSRERQSFDRKRRAEHDPRDPRFASSSDAHYSKEPRLSDVGVVKSPSSYPGSIPPQFQGHGQLLLAPPVVARDIHFPSRSVISPSPSSSQHLPPPPSMSSIHLPPPSSMLH